MGDSRKYPYPYHGQHIGIPKGIWGYIERNSEGSLGEFIGGFIGLEFQRHSGGGGGQESNYFQFGVLKHSSETTYLRMIFTRKHETHSIQSTCWTQSFQWSWSLSYAYMLTAGSCSLTTEIGHKSDRELFFDCFARIQYRRFQQRVFSPYSADIVKIHVELLHYNIPCDAH